MTYTDTCQLPLTLTVKQAANVLGIGIASTYELCHSGRLTVMRKISIPKASLVRFLDNSLSNLGILYYYLRDVGYIRCLI